MAAVTGEGSAPHVSVLWGVLASRGVPGAHGDTGQLTRAAGHWGAGRPAALRPNLLPSPFPQHRAPYLPVRLPTMDRWDKGQWGEALGDMATPSP